MAPRFKDEDDDKSKNDEQKKEYAFPLASVLLVPVERGTKRRRERDQTLIALSSANT